MIQLIRTNAQDQDFRELVMLLDADLLEADGEEDQLFYGQFNKLDNIRHVIVAYEDNIPVSCGAIKEYDAYTMEVKRMYTLPDRRGKGIAGKILSGLEKWAAELFYHKCILETGRRQQKAISLYTRQGYRIIPNYGQYIGDDNSVCFEKEL